MGWTSAPSRPSSGHSATARCILDLFEALSGHRFTHNYMRPGGVLYDLPKGWLQHLRSVARPLRAISSLPELEGCSPATRSSTRAREGVGYIDPQQALAYALTGPDARASGIQFDMRVSRPYGAYREIAVHTQTRPGRRLLRPLPRPHERDGTRRPPHAVTRWISSPAGRSPSARPIALRPPRGETYYSVESGRGEGVIYMISDGSEYPYRAKIRAPSFVNLQILPELLRGNKIGDVIAILGSIDIVLGDVDR